MKYILSSFLLWRILLVIFSIISINIIPLRIGFLGGGLENYLKNPLIWGWANMDGMHYLSIAQNGYFQYEQAFFPLYPLLIRFFILFTGGNFLLSGLLVSHLFFIGSLVVLYYLLKLDYPSTKANWVIFLLLGFSTSFFFVSVYSESLFLFLTLCAVYFTRKKKWYMASFFALFAGATRLMGIFLVPLIAYEIWKQKTKIRLINLFPLLISSLGLIFYMVYLKITVNDPLFFFHAQPAFGANRSGNKLIFLPQVIFRYIKIFVTSTINYDYLIALFEFLMIIITIYILIKNIYKIRVSYQIFAWLSLLTPTLTGSLSSIPRYILTIFPFFIALSLEKNLIKYIFLIINASLLIILTMYFFRGYFVA